jgi:hypothetical protein
MNIKSACITSVLAGGFVLSYSQFLPANAYGVTANNAITLNANDIGRTLDPITWLVPTSNSLPQELSAQAIFTVLDLQSSFIDLSIDISNTTEASFNSAILSFGLGIEQSVDKVSVTSKGSAFDSATLLASNKTFPGGFKGIDVCAFAANNCTGGDIKQGLQNGQSDTFTLRISNTTNSFASGVTIGSYPIKFQSDYGSYEAAGVPEPITIIGSGLALGFGALLKKETTKKRSKVKA